MANNIFVSYKYSDRNVQQLSEIQDTRVRDYVDIIERKIDSSDHVYKGENDGESMSTLSDSTIGSKLGDKIFYSSVTIVLISKGMRETYTAEKEQWIPWEISYSLKEQSRQGGNSKTNAVLGVVLPDENGRYDYYLEYKPECDSTTYHPTYLFQILNDNMFNHKKKDENSHLCNGTKIYDGHHSFIYSIKWEYFISDINKYVGIALDIRKKINEYEITKTIK